MKKLQLIAFQVERKDNGSVEVQWPETEFDNGHVLPSGVMSIDADQKTDASYLGDILITAALTGRDTITIGVHQENLYTMYNFILVVKKVRIS